LARLESRLTAIRELKEESQGDAEMALTFRHATPPVDGILFQTICQMFELCFGEQPDSEFRSRLNEKPRLLVLLAELDGKPVGFKIGYERHRGVFFSWLGGVHPDFRRVGVARALVRHQHDWCITAGYSEVQTETYGDVAGMLILNLQEGFEVFGTHLADDKRIRVQLRKRFSQCAVSRNLGR
jgi:GNAT superfamily N-acetyltransferase